eukprot:4652354-Amphidinium_carterae.2
MSIMEHLDHVYKATTFGQNHFAKPASTNQQTFSTSATATSQEEFTPLKAFTFNTVSLSDGRGLGGTGQLTVLADAMVQQDYAFAFLQESRLRLAADFDMKEFYIHHTPAVSGYGGLVTMIRKGLHISIVNKHNICQRLQLTTIKYHGKIIHLYNSHAPTTLDKAETHHVYQQQLILATTNIPRDHLVLIGIDLNCRMGRKCDEFEVVGEYTTAMHPRSSIDYVLNHFQQEQLYLLNTMLAPSGQEGILMPPDHPELRAAVGTWKERRSTSDMAVHQIDYLIGSHAILHSAAACSPLPWHHFDTLHASDHRPVSLQFLLQHNSCGSFVRVKRVHKRFISAQHQADCEALTSRTIQQLEKQFPPESTPPHIQLFQRQQVIQQCLHRSAPKNALVPRKPWVQADTLIALKDLNRTRRLKAMWHRLFQSLQPIDAVQQQLSTLHQLDSECLIDVRQPQSTTHTLHFAITKKCRETRQMLRRNKQEWIEERCARIDATLSTTNSWEAYQLVRALSNTRKHHRATRLRLDSGVITTDPEVLDETWRNHWAAHFQAHTSTINSFNNFNYPQHHQSTLTNQQLFTIPQATAAIQKLNPRRAAPNPLHSCMWRHFAHVLAPSLAAAANDSYSMGCVPNHWAGAVTIPVRKKQLSELNPSCWA